MMAVTLRRCAQCSREKPEADFVGRRGSLVTYCSECRTKYYGGAEHVSGEANVGPTVRRGSSRKRLGLGARARTENLSRLPRGERVHLRLVDELDAERPRTRADCIDGPRPCPWVSCRHNLFLDVDVTSIKYNFGDREPEEMPADGSCALDIADRGAHTLDEVGTLSNITRERARQIEVKALDRAKRRGRLQEFSDAAPGAVKPRFSAEREPDPVPQDEQVENNDADDVVEPPTKISFFAEAEVVERSLGDAQAWDAYDRADELVCKSVWTIFTKDSNARGFAVRNVKSENAAKAKSPWRNPRAAEGGAVMSNRETQLTELQQTVLDAYRQHMEHSGEPPTNRELAALARIEGANDNSRMANVSRIVQILRRRGLVGAPRRGPGAKAAAPAQELPPPVTPKRPRREAAVVESRPTRTTSRDPVVRELIAKRDALINKAKAIDVAIEALATAL